MVQFGAPERTVDSAVFEMWRKAVTLPNPPTQPLWYAGAVQRKGRGTALVYDSSVPCVSPLGIR